MPQPLLGDRPAIERAVKQRRPRLAVVEPFHLALHRRVEGHRLLDDAEALRQRHHPPQVVGIVLRPRAGARKPHRAVIDPHPVAHLAAEQPMHRHPRRLAREIPERHLDDADRRPPGLEAAALADPPHHPLDQPRVLADQRLAQRQHMRLQIRLPGLDLAIAGDALVADDPHHRAAADHRAFHIDDLHLSPSLGQRRADRPRRLDRREPDRLHPLRARRRRGTAR